VGVFAFLVGLSDFLLLISLLLSAMIVDVKRRAKRMLNTFILKVGNIVKGLNQEV
jgi:hypothetical protein